MDPTSSTGSTSQNGPTSPRAAPLDGERSRLAAFVGEWRLEGRQYESPFGPAAPISGSESFEWLPGGAFLIHRLAGNLGGREMACVEVIEESRGLGVYRLHTFYDNGSSNLWTARFAGEQFVLTGNWPEGKHAVRVRCIVSFADDGRRRAAQWQRSFDDSNWKTFWDITATRIARVERGGPAA
jgi:hypothetical protein